MLSRCLFSFLAKRPLRTEPAAAQAIGIRASARSVSVQYGESVEKHGYRLPMRPHALSEDNGYEKHPHNEGANHVSHQPHACRSDQQRKAAKSCGQPRDGVRQASAPSASLVAAAIRVPCIGSWQTAGDGSSFREVAWRGNPHIEWMIPIAMQRRRFSSSSPRPVSEVVPSMTADHRYRVRSVHAASRARQRSRAA